MGELKKIVFDNIVVSSIGNDRGSAGLEKLNIGFTSIGNNIKIGLCMLRFSDDLDLTFFNQKNIKSKFRITIEEIEG